MRRTGPLAGLTVLELGGVGPAAYCGMLLADLGARVIRVERPQTVTTFPDERLRFGVVSRGRESIAVDLSRPEGAAAVRRLVSSVDALIEGFRPGVAERLGLGPDECLSTNPGLVYGRVTGWGRGGPWSAQAGHEQNYVAVAGGMAPACHAGEPPAPPVGQHGHIGAAASFLALGVVSALLEARDSGRGQVVDASVLDSVASRLGLALGMRAAADADGSGDREADAPFADTYRCADGGYVAVAAIEDVFYSRLLETLGLSDHPLLLENRFERTHWPEMRRVLAERFGQRARDEWCRLFSDVDACVSPVLTLEEAVVHEHNRARGVYQTVGGLTHPAPTPRFSRTALAAPGPPPEPGTHTVPVLREAGLSADDVAALLETGVAMTAPEQER